jgi:hypothetical protein
MRNKIDTSGIQFRVAATAKAKHYKDDQKQATTPDGRPVWTVQLDAIDAAHERKETIWVEVAGDEPKLTFEGFATVRELVYVPWVGRDGKIRRAYRADAVENAASPKQHAAA